MSIVKGKIKADEETIGLARLILEEYGFKSEEEAENAIYFEEERDPFYFNRTKAYEMMRKLYEVGIKNIEIQACSIVEIYKYSVDEENGFQVKKL
ncbi:MAG: hypothetical protein WBH76_01410 [Dictyoglomaceae bacterium]